MQTETLDHTNVLNFVAKYLSREGSSVAYAEPWRCPIVDSCQSAGNQSSDRVTFVYRADEADDDRPVGVVGSFDQLWDATPLVPVLFDGRKTRWRAVSVLVPIGQVHTYKFIVEGQATLDPINPQRRSLDNGFEWSRFFTHYCTAPVSLESWEIAILARLTNEMLPFTSGDAQRFMDLYYYTSDKTADETTFHQAYRLEQPVGAVNFIDNLLSREEGHRLFDYKTCLRLINDVLQLRFPSSSPADISKEDYLQLYRDMATDKVDGWDTSQYQSPGFFLQMLRRHTYSGVFSHPKYGGNAGGAGWAYLESTYRDAGGGNCFDWKRSIETPLGKDTGYFG
jgi:hypothetical protein